MEKKGNVTIDMDWEKAKEQISEQLGANLFLLPSSVHEMILFPDYGSYQQVN